MSIRKPLVFVNGRIRELNSTDLVAGALPTFRSTGRNFTIAVNSAQAINGTLPNDIIRAWPFWVSTPIMVSGFKIESVASVAGASCRVAVYKDNLAGYPGVIVPGLASNSIDCSTPGVKSVVLSASVKLLPGLYWQVVNSSNSPNLRLLPAAALSQVLGYNESMGADSAISAIASTLVNGQLPIEYPLSGSLETNTPAPLVLYKTSVEAAIQFFSLFGGSMTANNNTYNSTANSWENSAATAQPLFTPGSTYEIICPGSSYRLMGISTTPGAGNYTVNKYSMYAADQWIGYFNGVFNGTYIPPLHNDRVRLIFSLSGQLTAEYTRENSADGWQPLYDFGIIPLVDYYARIDIYGTGEFKNPLIY
jgi:hypothetical protein